MLDALELARVHRPHPNPSVGAIVFDADGRRVGQGAHVAPGTPHAEARALAEAGDSARGGTLVVTLEPHDHHGRTPPCTQAIIEAGIHAVVVGALDPDSRVDGRGVARLRAAGIDVESGIATAEVEASDPGYFHHRRTGRARTVLKTASTLDGQTAAMDGTSKWLTGEDARRDAHSLRALADAVMVGAGTVLADDPRLDVRTGVTTPQPRPVVVAGTRSLPANARVWARAPIIVSPVPLVGVEDVLVTPGNTGRVDLRAALQRLPDWGILEILVEGGAGLAGSLLEDGLIDGGVSYLAARLAGGVGRSMFDREFSNVDCSLSIEIASVRSIGPDIRVDWVFR